MDSRRRSNPLHLMKISDKYPYEPRNVERPSVVSDYTSAAPMAPDSSDGSEGSTDHELSVISEPAKVPGAQLNDAALRTCRTRSGALPSRIGIPGNSSPLCDLPNESRYYHLNESRLPRDVRKSKLAFLKAAGRIDVDGLEGTLPNRRVSTLSIEKANLMLTHQGTLPETTSRATRCLVERAVIFEDPAMWLVMKRWPFLPTSEDQLRNGYHCPDHVRARIEMDIAYLLQMQPHAVPEVDLLEYFFLLDDWYESGDMVDHEIFQV
ncbi:uncharacterized protein MELLADRAFT_69595 [Melampsora larici-populina 98AG31]|uniref:Uncharacterized protein n=1 Tax=Melampsora larici-populina (strain 98AG31 / pathotype 3-4-7) TaxID=747676 RepID=F4SBA8_MELLP|nr:uncharacterized protein MELLADRAFT_69595 [Melampsora larici-populina 98AG31]EGF98074.1 hypothetical protein MELLADRAFT_69595 [Melampsora larici-populina 98AG31]